MDIQTINRSFVAYFTILIMCSTVSADTSFVDDFNDGNDNGWQRTDTTIGQAWGPGTFDASSGAYQLRGAGNVPTGQEGILLSLYGGSTNPAFKDGYLRTTLRTENNTLLYLVMRVDVATFTGYVFGASANTGRFFWNKVVNNSIVEEGPTIVPNSPFAVGQDWVLEAGTVGNQLSMKAWRLGDPEPAVPQWTHTDSTIPTGQFGVGANHWAVLPPETVNATFDDVTFRIVPEPSMLASIAAALFAALTYRTRNRREFADKQLIVE
jgi:hypothetical protein